MTDQLRPAVATPGLFSPSAKVHCHPCIHRLASAGSRMARWYADLDPASRRELFTASTQPPNEGEALGLCDSCGCQVWIRRDVALCQRIARSVPGARLTQTGGMCVATEVYNRRFHIIFDDESNLDATSYALTSAADAPTYNAYYSASKLPHLQSVPSPVHHADLPYQGVLNYLAADALPCAADTGGPRLSLLRIHGGYQVFPGWVIGETPHGPLVAIHKAAWNGFQREFFEEWNAHRDGDSLVLTDPNTPDSPTRLDAEPLEVGGETVTVWRPPEYFHFDILS